MTFSHSKRETNSILPKACTLLQKRNPQQVRLWRAKPTCFPEEKIIATTQKVNAGLKGVNAVHKHGVSQWTYYRWKAKYSGMTVSETIRLRRLEDQNRRPKQIVANQVLDIEALKGVLSTK